MSEMHSSYAKTNPKVISTKTVSDFRNNILPLKKFKQDFKILSVDATERDAYFKICPEMLVSLRCCCPVAQMNSNRSRLPL